MGDVKFKPQVSLVIGSFQYAKHSDACPIRVPKMQSSGQQMVFFIGFCTIFLLTFGNEILYSITHSILSSGCCYQCNLRANISILVVFLRGKENQRA